MHTILPGIQARGSIRLACTSEWSTPSLSRVVLTCARRRTLSAAKTRVVCRLGPGLGSVGLHQWQLSLEPSALPALTEHAWREF